MLSPRSATFRIIELGPSGNFRITKGKATYLTRASFR
jgi:hypothetical protein